MEVRDRLNFRYRIVDGGTSIIDDNTGYTVRRNYIEDSDGDDVSNYADVETGEIVYSYYGGGYEYVSCMFSPRMIGRMDAASLSKSAYSFCLSVVHLNKDRFELEDLEEHCKFVCANVYSKGNLKIDFEPIWKKALGVAVGTEPIKKRLAKFLWMKHLSYDDKMYYVRMTNASEKRQRMNNNIEMAISSLLDENPPIFITAKAVCDKIAELFDQEISQSTARNYMQQFIEEIHKHNVANFETHDFNIYVRTCNVNNVVSAIKVIAMMNDVISKNRVSKKSGVSYPSVLKIWEDDEVQDVLNKYNSII